MIEYGVFIEPQEGRLNIVTIELDAEEDPGQPVDGQPRKATTYMIISPVVYRHCKSHIYVSPQDAESLGLRQRDLLRCVVSINQETQKPEASEISIIEREDVQHQDFRGKARGGVPANNPRNHKTIMCHHFMSGNPKACFRGTNCTFAHGEHELRGGAGGAPSKGSLNGPGSSLVLSSPMGMGDGPAAASECPEVSTTALGPSAGLIYKTVLCRHFLNGLCSRGVCAFAHGEHELGTPTEISGTNALLLQTNGSDPAAANHKTLLCRHYRDGVPNSCGRGTLCSFAHGSNDLKVDTNSALKQINKYKCILCRDWEESKAAVGRGEMMQPKCPRGDLCTFAHGEEELGRKRPTPEVVTMLTGGTSGKAPDLGNANDPQSQSQHPSGPGATAGQESQQQNLYGPSGSSNQIQQQGQISSQPQHAMIPGIHPGFITPSMAGVYPGMALGFSGGNSWSGAHGWGHPMPIAAYGPAAAPLPGGGAGSAPYAGGPYAGGAAPPPYKGPGGPGGPY